MKSRMMMLASLLCLVVNCVAGCAALNAKPPVEQFAEKLADQAIIPAVRQGLSQGVEQLTVQAGAQGINPRYVVEFEGMWVTGLKGRASVGVDGIAGQLQVSSAGGDRTQGSPSAQGATQSATPEASPQPADANYREEPFDADHRQESP